MSEANRLSGEKNERGVDERSPSARQDASAAANTPRGSAQSSVSRCACVSSTDLLRGEKTVEISHNGSTYRLQATRLGKLILTK